MVQVPKFRQVIFFSTWLGSLYALPPLLSRPPPNTETHRKTAMASFRKPSTILLFATVALQAWCHGDQPDQRPLQGTQLFETADPVITDTSGLSTFANIPYVNCLSAASKVAYDIAIFGAPFDTVCPTISWHYGRPHC